MGYPVGTTINKENRTVQWCNVRDIVNMSNSHWPTVWCPCYYSARAIVLGALDTTYIGIQQWLDNHQTRDTKVGGG